MPKTRRVQIRLTEEDHALLTARAQQHFDGSITRAIEWYIRIFRPAAIIGVRPAGRRGRVSFSVRFSNGMVVHGFLWSRGGQLLRPRHWAGDHYVRQVDGSREFWADLREFCHDWFTPRAEVEQEPEYQETVVHLTG
jgi:hypothetical protein